jgi:hypothetical protein
MWEFNLANVHTDECTVIFGYTLQDAFRRNPRLDPEEWECWHAEYID